MKGRPPKSNELKELQGTLRSNEMVHDPLSMAPLSAVPSRPSDLTPDEGDFWDYVAIALFNAGRLRSVDMPNIKAAAFWWGVFCKARNDVNATGFEYETETDYKRLTPSLAAAEKASKMLKDFGDRYGLNLLYADRIKGGEKPGQDDLQKLLGE